MLLTGASFLVQRIYSGANGHSKINRKTKKIYTDHIKIDCHILPHEWYNIYEFVDTLNHYIFYFMPEIKRTTLCYINSGDRYLMLYRNRKPDDPNEGKWLGIGGRIEYGETPDECNIREVREETGLNLRSAWFCGVIQFRSDTYEDEDMYLYTSDDFEPADPSALEKFIQTGEYELPECDEGELKWIDRESLMDLPMWEGDKEFLKRILGGKRRISMTLRYEGEHCTVEEDRPEEESGMNAVLHRTCELFIENRDSLRDTFRWEGEVMLLLGSLILTSVGYKADEEELRKCEEILRNREGLFSPLRGNLKMAALCSMAVSNDPENYIADVNRAYNLIRIGMGRWDERCYLAALIMSSMISDKEELLPLTDLAGEIYTTVYGDDRWYSERSGYIAAAAAACSGCTDAEKLKADAEACRDILEGKYGKTIAFETLCVMLALDKAETSLKCARFEEICGLLEQKGIHCCGEVLPALGVLTRLDATNAQIAEAVADADEFLRAQKGFGIFGSGSERRHLFAAMLVLDAYLGESGADHIAESAILDSMMRSRFAAMTMSSVALTVSTNSLLATIQ